MAEVQAPDKPRKSVSFDPQATVVDEFGEVTETNGHANAEKTTAESHATENGSAADDKDVDDTADMFKDMKLKKKKKAKTPKEAEEAEAAPEPAADGEFDPSALKKKKKKKAKPAVDVDDFEAKLAEAGVDKEGGDDADADADADEGDDAVAADEDGDMDAGTGIWAHDDKRPLSYSLLLERIYHKLLEMNPDAGTMGGKSIKIPPPQCLREGNKKTIFANIIEISKRLHREDWHVRQYLFAELGTSGSVDGSGRLVIKGRFQAKQLEQVLRNYIREYVTCKTCKSVDTLLGRGENRLWYVTCNSCNSRRSVQPIKTGFSAQVGKRKRQQG